MKLRVFVFDDDSEIRSLISSILLERGHEVHEFSEPGTCPLFLESECPCPAGYTCGDVIITDLNMPGVTGLQFIENQIKHGCKVRNYGVISGSWLDSQLKHATELGCKIFNKPFGIDELTGWLNQCEKTIDPARKLWDWFKQKKA